MGRFLKEVPAMVKESTKTLTPGMEIGRWTLLYKLPSEKNKWCCRCQCGTERAVSEKNLRYGGSLSCGCYRKDRARETLSADLQGRQFGDLTVIEKAETKKGGVRWLCKCSCGEHYTALGTLLMTGKVTRCSSKAHQRNYSFKDITGQRFGRLTAIAPTGDHDKSGYVIWHCRCDCGNETDVSYNVLQYSNRKSCGCQKKEHDQKLQTFLTHVDGTSIDMLKSKKIPKDNTTGYRGVYFIRGKYVAKIVFRKKQYLLGSFDQIEDAAAARKEAETLLFDGVAEHYRLWKQYADANPRWAEANPVQVQVEQKNGKLQVTLLPEVPQCHF